MKPRPNALLVLLICASCAAAAATAESFSNWEDVRFWVGSGTKQALLTIDWNGDSSSDAALAWGFRWDGAATAESMLRDVLQADDRLFAKLGANMGFGVAVYGLGYDANDDGQFSLDDGTGFDADGIAISGPTDLTESDDAADLYREGWEAGFWHIATASENPLTGEGSWASASFGVSGVPLTDGRWTSLAFTLDTESTTAFADNLQAASARFAIGDFQHDGAVDELDLAIWNVGYGTAGSASQQTGDANGDTDVDGRDYLLWQRNFSPASGNPIASLTIPEPSTALLCGCGLALLIPPSLRLTPFPRQRPFLRRSPHLRQKPWSRS
ncbi:MAG: hypothetical protein ACR2NM_14730 [Bythopirellula sp.]